MNHSRYLWNYFLAERSYYARRPAPLGRPLVFSIETTSVCNLACVMCPYKEMTRDHEMMDVDLFRRVVDEIRDYNGILWLHNLGEPLAHPRFAELIRIVKAAGLPCGLSTNATLLDDRRTGEILDSGLDKIVLCMDGVTRETFERLRVGADFGEVTANIEGFLREKRSRGLRRPESIVQIIYMKETEACVPQFRSRWESLADRVHVKLFNTWAGQVESIEPLSDPEHRYVPEHSAAATRYPCGYLWRNVVVTANGDVIPCCVDYDARMVMGNVREQSLAEIWTGEKFARLRADHLAGRFTDTCASCREWVGGPANRTYPLGRPFLEKLRRAVDAGP